MYISSLEALSRSSFPSSPHRNCSCGRTRGGRDGSWSCRERICFTSFQTAAVL